MQRDTARERRCDDISAVFLDPALLLKISSTQLDDRIARVQERRPLTRAERDEVARQRRLVHNRESARRSRLTQKLRVQLLELENAELRMRLERAEELYRSARDPALSALFSDCDTLSF